MKRASLVILHRLAAGDRPPRWPRPTCASRRTARKTYSDRPLPGGQPVDIAAGADLLGAAGTASAGLHASARQQQALNDAANFRYAAARSRRAPTKPSTNPETVTSASQLTPGLRAGDEVQFTRRRHSSAATRPIATSAMLHARRTRHAHRAVRIIDRYGKSVLQRRARTFHVQRTSLNSPQLRPPPRRTAAAHAALRRPRG